MTWVAPFEAGRYRKRLAGVDRRGGPEASDAFELYDLPLAEDLSDEVVRARIEEVWAFWQKQRDHPKLGALVGRLVEGHAERSRELLDTQRRRFAARRVLTQRLQRDEGRYRVLDAAVERLVQRHGSVAADKVEGLIEFGAVSGITREEVLGRLAGKGQAVPGPPGGESAAPGLSAERRRQVRDLLAEFGLLNSSDVPATLLVLLDLGPAADVAQVRARASAWRSRAREMPPERLRAVADELLVHVAELLEPGNAAIATYVDAVVADVTDLMRPQVRAAVLVEDRLVADDHAHLVAAAQELGLDRRRAEAVLASLAAELGVAVEAGGTGGTRGSGGGTAASVVPGWYQRRRSVPRPGPPDPGPDADLTPGRIEAVRLALRDGRAVTAQRLLREATGLAGGADATRLRDMASEIDAVLAEAVLQWRAAKEAMAAGRFTTAAAHLEQIRRTAVDLHSPAELDALLARALDGVAGGDTAVAAAMAGPEADRAAALLAVVAGQGDHPAALAALAQLAVLPPGSPTTTRLAGGAVLVRWIPSGTPDVSYKVSRLRLDGSWQVVGRSPGLSLEDGGAPPGPDPVYAVTAVQAGRSSDAVRTDAHPVAGPTAAPHPAPAAGPAAATRPAPAAGEELPVGPAVPSGVRATVSGTGSVVVTWTASAATGDADDPEYRVRCQGTDGRWRVVGRTRDTRIEDGGADAGIPGVYAVSAAVGGMRSTESLSPPT